MAYSSACSINRRSRPLAGADAVDGTVHRLAAERHSSRCAVDHRFIVSAVDSASHSLRKGVLLRMGLSVRSRAGTAWHDKQEAQNQADIREAELRGITVGQLLQMRQQAQAMAGESMVGTAEEEVSHGMQR